MVRMKLNWYLKRHHHDYWSLVEPFRKDGKNQHNKLYYFGRLTDEEVKTINSALDILKNCNIEKPKLKDIIFNDHWRFLDVAFLNFIWGQWGISKIFSQSENKKVQTSEIIKILTIYHCLDPGSYLSAVEWYDKTKLDRILQINAEQINKSRIFRELDCIEDKKKDIENYLYTTLKERDVDSLRFVFYDLTDSYFEGRNCELATPGRTKSNGFQKKRVVLSLLVNSNGYPFAWEILEDYSADVNTIKDLSTKWKNQFGFEDNEIILVFDRGMVSDENLKHLELKKYIYITAMDKNQIPKLKNVRIERFEILNSENIIEQIEKMTFVKYDDQTYYENLGIVNDRRYVLIFNPDMYVDENNSREKLIIRAKAYLEEESKDLSNAEKSRNESTTRNKIDKELKTMKADKFIEYDLESLVANIDIRSAQKTYEILRDGIIGKISLKSTGEESLNLMLLQSQQKKIMELFQCEGIVEINYLKSIG